MKILVIGASGSGKTYVSSKLKELGVNAVDADLIDGLSGWYDGRGNEVKYPNDADQKFLDNHSFLWDKEFLKKYLDKNPDIYLFGSSGNMFEMLDLFDRVYFLKAGPLLLKERLTHESRKNPMGITEYQRENAIRWGLEIEKKAKDLGIRFVDATLSPKKISELIRS